MTTWHGIKYLFYNKTSITRSMHFYFRGLRPVPYPSCPGIYRLVSWLCGAVSPQVAKMRFRTSSMILTQWVRQKNKKFDSHKHVNHAHSRTHHAKLLSPTRCTVECSPCRTRRGASIRRRRSCRATEAPGTHGEKMIRERETKNRGS